MIKIGYKVVRIGGNGWISSHQPVYLNGIKYQRNKIIKPKKGNGPLTLFKTKESAEKFRNKADNCLFLYKVIKVQYKSSIYDCVWQSSVKYTLDYLYHLNDELFVDIPITDLILADWIKVID